MSNYDDIINLKRPDSKREKMSINDRAAQFAPFSSLQGYEEQVIESYRETIRKREISEDGINDINKKLNILGNRLEERNVVYIVYFVKDDKKSGGSYKKVEGIIKKIDLVYKRIVLENNIVIGIEDIIDINSKIFNIESLF